MVFPWYYSLFCPIVVCVFRCPRTSECVPVFENDVVVDLPVIGNSSPLKIEGRCVIPCETRCANEPDNVQCGTDGRTYTNSCYRTCASNTAQVRKKKVDV